MSQRRREKQLGRMMRALWSGRSGVEVLDRRLLMSVGPGNPDISFDFDGRLEVRSDAGNPGRVVSTVQRSDGFTYVLTELPGAQGVTGVTGPGSDGVAVTRLNNDGSVDLTWGSAGTGRYVFNLGLGVDGAVLLDRGAGSGFFIAGTAYVPRLGSGGFDRGGDFLLAAVTDSGTSDFTFNTGQGFKQYDLNLAGSQDDLISAGLDGSGNIILHGRHVSALGVTSAAFLKVDAGGNVVGPFGDTSFALAGGGFRDSQPGAISSGGQAMAVAADGSFVYAVNIGSSAQLRRFSLTGMLVDTRTLVGSSVFPKAVAIDNVGGGIYAAVTDVTNLVVFKSDPTAGLPASGGWGQGGVYSLNANFGLITTVDAALAVRSGGALAVAMRGTANSAPVAAVIGIDAAGFRDTGFDAGGFRDFTTGSDPGTLTINVGPTGRVLAGASFLASPFFSDAFATDLYRADSAGTPDAVFGSQGRRFLDPFVGGSPTEVGATQVNSDGSVLSVWTTPTAPSGLQSIGVELSDRYGVRLGGSIFDAGRFAGNIKVGGVFKRTDGQYAVIFSARDTLLGSSNDILLMGLIRADGSVNPSFGINGFQQFSPSGDVGYTAESATRINNDLILISGATFTGSGPGQRSLTRVGLNGVLDTSFGSGGTVLRGDFDSGTYRTVVASQTAGQRIYAVGTVRQSGVPSLQVDVFEFDGTFAATGQIGNAASQSFGLSAVLSADGSRLYVGGRTLSGFNEIAYLRSFVTSTAALDAGFGTAGVVTPSAVGHASGIRALALDPAGGLIGVGDANGAPYIQRFNAATGAVDTTYGLSVSPPFGQVGKYTSVTFDAASRPVVAGIVGSIGTSGARVGVVQRFQATAAVAPSLISFDSRPFPKPGDAFGVIRARFQAPVGLLINPSVFGSAVEYTRPDTSVGTAAVLSTTTPDGGRTWDVRFKYESASGGPLAAGDSGTYVFRLLANSITDEVGNQFPTTTQTLATINVNLTGVPGPGDPDAGFSGDGREEFSSDLSPGELIQIVERAGGGAFLLSNLASNGETLSSAGFAVTKLLPSGDLDTSFGTAGRYVFSLFGGVSAVQLIDLGQGNGFMVAGTVGRYRDPTVSSSGTTKDLVLVKVTDSGTTDGSFAGGSGWRMYDPTGGDENATGAVKLSDGSIVIAAAQQGFGGPTVVLKVSATGEPDEMFGDTSFRISPGAFQAPAGHDFNPFLGSRSMAVTASDTVYMVGTNGTFLHSAVFSFGSDGLFNTSGAFSPQGVTNFSGTFVFTSAANAIVVSPQGSIFVGVRLTAGLGDIGVLKIQGNGAVDQAYGNGDGFFLYNADSGSTSEFFSGDLDIEAFSDDSVGVAAGTRFSAGAPDNQTNVSTFVLNPAGVLDTNYGGGLVTIDLLQAGTGALISVKNATILAGGSRDSDLADGRPATAIVSRLDLTGAVVPTYTDGVSGPGRVSLGTIVNGAIGEAEAVHVNPDGSTFTVYLTHDPRGRDAIGTRALDPNGNLIGGTLAGGGQFTEYSVAGIFKRTDGNYLVAFSAKADDGQFGPGLLVMAMYDATGGLVTTYGTGGFLVATPNASSDNTVTAMARVSDDQFLLVGREGGRPVLYRISEGGVAIGTTLLAAGFGETVAVQVETTAVFNVGLVYVVYVETFAPRIVGAGQLITDAVIQRRQLGGAFDLDPTFGVGGVVRYSAAANSVTTPQSLLLDTQSSRLILGGKVATQSSSFSREVVAAFSTVNGSLDTSFGNAGQFVGSRLGVISSVQGIALDPAGGYLIAGASQGLPSLQRLSPSGVLDVNYGQQFRPSVAHYGEYLGLTLDLSGRPIVFGYEGQLEGAPRPGVVRRFTETVPVAAPLALLFGASPFGGFGSTSQEIEIEFTAFGVRNINEATLSGSNIILTLNGSPAGSVTFNAITFRGANRVRASYSLNAPGGAFNFTNNGSYVATLVPNSVADTAGVFASQAVLFSFATNFQPVAVSLSTQPAEPRFGSPFVDITVQYAAADGASIDPQSINAGNISLFRDGTAEGSVSVASVASITADLVQVVYRLVPGGGAFVFSNNGFYEAVIQPGNSVRTTDGVPTPAGTIHTFTTSFQPVAASFATPAVPRIGDTELQFSVTYTAPAGRLIDLSSILSSNVLVTGPSGERPVITLVGTSGSGQSVTVTYAFDAPGGTFGPAVAGTYTFGIDAQGSPVRDDLGSPAQSGVIGSLVVQYVRPSAAVASSQLTVFGSSTSQFTVTYTPGTGRSMDINSINGDEIRITRPDGSTLTATLVSLTASSGTTVVPLPPDATITAVYSFTAASPIFGFGDVGQYAVDILPGSVTDTQNSPINAASLGNIAVVFERPTASATTPVTPRLGDSFVEFNVIYSAGSGSIVAETTLGNDDIRVALPDGSSVLATLVSSATGSDGTVLGTYRFSPSGGVFSSTNGGIYTVGLVAGGVTDSRSIPIAAGVLFSLTVAISGVPGNLISVNVPAGPYLPGDVINPTVVVTNPLSGVASQPFVLRFFIRIGGATVSFGDINVNPLAAGATRTILFDGRLSLPASTQLLPGTYEIGARVIAADGSESGAAVVSPIQAVITAVPLPTPGTLDPTFGGGDGIVTNFVPGPTITLVGSVAQAGSKLVSGGFDSNGDFVLLRFNADGTPDTTFGVAGQITLDVSGGTDTATTISDDLQGRIVLGGTSTVGGTTVFSVVRFNADGSLDTSFNSTGILLFAPDGSQASLLRGVTSDRFGRPYLLGSVRAPQTEGGPVALQGVVIRLTPSGSVDGSFGSFGVISAALTDGSPGVLPFRDGQSELTSLLLLEDRIVVGGYSANADGTVSRFILAGLQYNGRLDTRFGTRGVFASTLGTTLDRITVLLEAPDGDVYAGGSRGTATNTTAVIFRINANGKIDRGFNRGVPLPLNTNTTFGTVSSLLDSVNNTVLITVATADSLAAAAAGQIGSVAFRLTAAGANDPFFNNGAPQVIFDASTIQPAAAGDLSGSFDSFVQSKQGATQRVEGGRIRSLSATPVTEGTSIAIAQLSQDGVDLRAVLTGNIPARVRPGFRGTAVLTVSNVGSLLASGRFSVTLVADGGTDVTLPVSILSGRIPQGATRTFRVRFALPTTTPEGTYQMQATLGTVARSFTDINTGNNTTVRPGDFVVATDGVRAASAVTGLRSEDSSDRRLSATGGLFSSTPLF